MALRPFISFGLGRAPFPLVQVQRLNKTRFNYTGVTLRAFSTSPPTQKDPISQVKGADIQTILERDRTVEIKKKLGDDPRSQISLEEYTSLCTEHGLSQEESSRFLQSLSQTGEVLSFPNSTNQKLRKTVFLRPQDFNVKIHQLLEAFSPEALKLKIDGKNAEIEEITRQLQPLKTHRDALEVKANRRANVIIFSGLGYCLCQFLAIGRLTWWELSWDVMEPVTYMLTFATALIGYTFFIATGSEYTYEGLKKTLRDRRLNKLIRRTGFNEARFQQLHSSLKEKETQFSDLVKQLSHYTSPEIPLPPKETKETKETKEK